MFDQILEKSMYASFILDICESLQGLFGRLRYCDTVYTLYIEEPCARAKFSQYVDNLRKLGYEDI